ncbi:MAG: phosphoribosylformylglycinamidine synthase subunit PurQ [Ktedonobacterales bacterium]|nr:phosphoribosylformylglycinamidine synthase subunit PurQ [Ktedonobacterales bacterium]
MKFGILVFPGTWSDRDWHHVLTRVLGHEAVYLWHGDRDLHDCDALIVPGGFAHGDYLRAGAIARFSPIMESVAQFAESGGLVLGSCNGFQILCEAGLLPGALRRNAGMAFRCEWVHLRVERTDTPFTSACEVGQVLRIPISHGEGNFYLDDAELESLEARRGVVLRYCDATGQVTAAANPNGSRNNIAGIINTRGNVMALMPHPERCCETVLGGTDGLPLCHSLTHALAASAR